MKASIYLKLPEGREGVGEQVGVPEHDDWGVKGVPDLERVQGRQDATAEGVEEGGGIPVGAGVGRELQAPVLLGCVSAYSRIR